MSRETEMFAFSGIRSPLSPVHTSPNFTIKGQSYQSIQDFVRQKMYLELTGLPYIVENNSGWGFRAMLKHQGVTETQYDKWALERGLIYTQMAMVQKAMDSPTVLEELQRTSNKFIVYTFTEDRFYGAGEKMQTALEKWYASRFQNTSVCIPAGFPIKFTDLNCSPQLWLGHNVLGTLWMCLRQKYLVEKNSLSSLMPYIADAVIPDNPLPRPMPREPISSRYHSRNDSDKDTIEDYSDEDERTFSRTTTPRVTSRIQHHSSYGQPLWEQGLSTKYNDGQRSDNRIRASLPYARPSRQSNRWERATHPLVIEQRKTGFHSHGDLRSPSPAHSSAATTPPRPERHIVTPTESEIDRQVNEAANFVGIINFSRQQMQQREANLSRNGLNTPSSQLARLQLRTPTEHVPKSSPRASIKSPSVRSTTSRRPEDEKFLQSLLPCDFIDLDLNH
ncbi:hypothetical protein M3Y94_01020400 [Aphelenchoides besseyi]|nr:hypothetical protein M3Y94_01020400 [Aphelenchoides besseyi]